MESLAPRRASLEQEEGFGVQPGSVSDVEVALNPQQRKSSLGKGRRSQHSSGCSKEVSSHCWLVSPAPAGAGHWFQPRSALGEEDLR